MVAWGMPGESGEATNACCEAPQIVNGPSEQIERLFGPNTASKNEQELHVQDGGRLSAICMAPKIGNLRRLRRLMGTYVNSPTYGDVSARDSWLTARFDSHEAREGRRDRKVALTEATKPLW